MNMHAGACSKCAATAVRSVLNRYGSSAEAPNLVFSFLTTYSKIEGLYTWKFNKKCRNARDGLFAVVPRHIPIWQVAVNAPQLGRK